MIPGKYCLVNACQLIAPLSLPLWLGRTLVIVCYRKSEVDKSIQIRLVYISYLGIHDFEIYSIKTSCNIRSVHSLRTGLIFSVPVHHDRCALQFIKVWYQTRYSSRIEDNTLATVGIKNSEAPRLELSPGTHGFDAFIFKAFPYQHVTQYKTS